jgi:acetyl esterase/lipase
MPQVRAMSTTSTPKTGTAAQAQIAETDITIELPGREPVAARTYGQRRPGQVAPLVLHFHGGTFVCGTLDSGRNVGRLLAATGAVVVSLAYPLAPKYPFPQPIEVGYAVLQWLYKQRVKMGGKGAPLFLAGEEAGGNLAAAVAVVARDRGHPPLAGQILLSPMLDPCTGTASQREATTEDGECRWASGWREYLSCPKDAMHPYAVPSTSLRLAQLPPALVLVGGDDPLRDEAQAYAARLRAAGVAADSHVLPSASNWPQALSEAEACTACSAVVQQHVLDFFEAVMAPRPAPG